MRSGSGAAIREVVEFQDRRLQAWIKAGLDHLGERYASRAEPIRRRVRSPTAVPHEAEPATERDRLEADLRELRRCDGSGSGILDVPAEAGTA